MEKDIVIAILSALSFFNLIFAVVNFNTNARLHKINRVLLLVLGKKAAEEIGNNEQVKGETE